MGRPIKKSLIGNTATAANQIAINAWVSGDSQARTGYIIKEKSYQRYYVNTSDGSGNTYQGQVTLTNGAPAAAGQCSLLITPYGASGSGATGIANVGVHSATIVTSGTGTNAANYVPGEVLQFSGGSNTTVANATVASVSVRIANITGSGTGFTVGDTFTFSGPGYNSNATVTVATTTGNGVVGTVTVSGGLYTGATLPANPVTPNAAVVTNAGVSSATFSLGWGVNQLTIKSPGVFQGVPTNPVSMTGSVSGTGATANLNYSVVAVQVTAAGSSYDAPPVISFNTMVATANATATAVLSGGAVSSVTINSGGIYSAVPGVTFANSSTTKYARKLNDHTVVAFDGTTYQWFSTGTTLTTSGTATIPTA